MSLWASPLFFFFIYNFQYHTWSAIPRRIMKLHCCHTNCVQFDFHTPRNTELEFKSRILSVCIASSESSNITQTSEGTSSHYTLFLWRRSDKLPPLLHGKAIAHTSPLSLSLGIPQDWMKIWKCLQIAQFYNTINILQEFCRLYLFPPGLRILELDA